ncbi:hypothetical protein PACTADRAFT_51297 [Pachysolen tannophilus NRRL Y-2460]|uniref:Mannosyl-oligosaccharide glucosidase n=1 Tax=Pachysolen tannophilus NRRL Y-2460 TaxID=669874 RepID=A0A1E4TRU7_PACTA|nr:hypothetical protein PACTADRAFT_51297 [Pachysolen tannophilus NRRL Y-2460]
MPVEYKSGETAEEARLLEFKNRTKHWKHFGPYLSERSWATVREDYSASGDAWTDFTFDQSRSRVYRWSEDGIAGVSDTHALVCLSLAFWNEEDEILKEKLFGVTGPQGNHGEDVKEIYYYLDNTPTHSYMKYLYKYPQGKFPYEQLVEENAKRSREEKEYELIDTGIFNENKYFDIVFEMAKDDDDPEELYFRITAYNRSSSPAPLHICPTILFRNTWSWGIQEEKDHEKPNLSKEFKDSDYCIKLDHWKFGNKRLIFAPSPGFNDDSLDIEPKLLFTDNETNTERLYKQKNKSKYYIVDEKKDAINPENFGTKACGWFSFNENGGVPPGDYVTIRYKLCSTEKENEIDEEAFDNLFERRQGEADEFYWRVTPLPLSDELRNVQRQAFAGMLWTKQYYHFIHDYWYHGDAAAPIKPVPDRANGRNKEWKHLYIDDILSMPDKWEYPFFAAWDTAFHCIPLAMIDPDFSKKQLDLLTREWYMHPNGQIPAYEWNFGDVNPPVHAWAAFRIFKIERKMYGIEDIDFLERVFQKLLLNFTWWVNRKDADGNNVFEGGFLGLDNIGIFNRSEPLPTGGVLEQADSTGWMAFFCLQMLNIALELAKKRHVYEDIASKFFEHFLLISEAMTFRNSSKDEAEVTVKSLWNEEDQFYYDAISWGDPWKQQLPIRSLVGLIPLYACLTLEPDILAKFPSFKKRLDWFIDKRRDIAERNIASMESRGVGERLLLALVDKHRLIAILEKMLDEDEFLSPYGIRSLSKYHEKHPFEMNVNGKDYKVEYLSGESDSGLFGGNSSWRGPVWFPTNFLLIESLQRFYLYYGPSLKVECPKGSGQMLNLAQVAEEIQQRLIHLFVPDKNGERACNGGDDLTNHDENFRDCVFFYEYFDGDTGRGLGASHQCGWTGIVSKLIQDVGVLCRFPKTPRSSNSIVSSNIEAEEAQYEIMVDDIDEENGRRLKNFLPKSPFLGVLGRRRSGKSMLNLTTQALEMTDEEAKTVGKNGFPGLSRYNSVATVNSDNANLSRQTTKSSAHSTTSEAEGVSGHNNLGLIHQIRQAMKNYKIKGNKDDDDQGYISSDELEAHT